MEDSNADNSARTVLNIPYAYLSSDEAWHRERLRITPTFIIMDQRMNQLDTVGFHRTFGMHKDSFVLLKSVRWMGTGKFETLHFSSNVSRSTHSPYCRVHTFDEYLGCILHFLGHRESYHQVPDQMGACRSRCLNAIHIFSRLIRFAPAGKNLRFLDENDALSHQGAQGPSLVAQRPCCTRKTSYDQSRMFSAVFTSRFHLMRLHSADKQRRTPQIALASRRMAWLSWTLLHRSQSCGAF